LLLLQLLAALAAVIALTEPFWYSKLPNRPGIIYMLDVSASMAASDVRQPKLHKNPLLKDRLAEAKALLKEDMLKLPSHTNCMIFLCSNGVKPLGTPTTNRRKLVNSLGSVEVSSAGFDETEVAEEIKTWLTIHKGIWKACLITDGGLNLGGRKIANVFGGVLRNISVGTNGNNIGITALRFGKNIAEFSVSNGWPVKRNIQVSLFKDDHLITKKRLTIPIGVSSQRIPFSNAIHPGVYRIQLDRQSGTAMINDTLANDDQYFLAVNEPRPIKILLAGNNNPFLQAALNQPGINLVETSKIPSGFNGEGWDLVIAEQISIPKALRCNLLTFRTLPPDSPLQFANTVNGVMRGSETSRDHLLLRYVDW
jgi:hypothetical protein